jgi:hypothetical protein
LQEEGTLGEIMGPEKSQCIQKNNTLKVKTPSLIVLIIIPITYISKVVTLQVGVVAVTTILKMFSFKRCTHESPLGDILVLFPFICFLILGTLTTKEDAYPSDFRGSHLTQKESN